MVGRIGGGERPVAREERTPPLISQRVRIGREDERERDDLSIPASNARRARDRRRVGS
jgi:hypothetical protein